MPQYIVERQGLYLYAVQHVAGVRTWLALAIPEKVDLAIFASRAKTGPVPTRNVNLTDELERYVQAQVKSGRYENASEVVRAALVPTASLIVVGRPWLSLTKVVWLPFQSVTLAVYPLLS